MADRGMVLRLLHQALGDPAATLRDGQWEAIDALVNRRERLLLVERTGWGKSYVYFIATRILRDRGSGPTLIVSPLLALMRNQIDAASRLGLRALTINSANRRDWPEFERVILKGEADVLLISPERLANDEFVSQVLLPLAGTIGLVVVDEAHCISDWGHDFRPDYRRLVNVLQRIPENVPVVGTTATANNRVIDDIRSQLGNIGTRRGPLMRETLALQTMRLPAPEDRLAWLASHVPDLPGTGIIYVLTRRDADTVADWLKRKGIGAEPYYSDALGEGFADSDSYRRHLESRLLGNEIKALVATTALGMGYDKPDLGFVVHYQAPASIIAYYQQVGRAGRGIAQALGILMSGAEDAEIHDYFRRSAFPREEWIAAILGALEATDGLSTIELEQTVNLRRGQVEHALKVLSVDNPSPIIRQGSKWLRTPVVYRSDRARVNRLAHQRETEWREVQAYLDERGCLMQFLARALDDPLATRCGKCSRCLDRPLVDHDFSRTAIASARRFLRHSEVPLETNRQVARAAFEIYDLRGNLPEALRAETGRILARWGDGEWGRSVMEDKRRGNFREELVAAAAEMIRDRWQPDPAPKWVTCVPSTRHPDLVPDFARRLAAAIGLPFWPGIRKIRENAPQKMQQNRFHQCRNLDGAFAVDATIPAGPVLLVDDICDSGWTLTVVAALLRRAGSGVVWPMALATSSMGS